MSNLDTIIHKYKDCRNSMNRHLIEALWTDHTFKAAFALAVVILLTVKVCMYLAFVKLGLEPVWAVLAMLVSFKMFKGYRMYVTSKEHV